MHYSRRPKIRDHKKIASHKNIEIEERKRLLTVDPETDPQAYAELKAGRYGRYWSRPSDQKDKPYLVSLTSLREKVQDIAEKRKRSSLTYLYKNSALCKEFNLSLANKEYPLPIVFEYNSNTKEHKLFIQNIQEQLRGQVAQAGMTLEILNNKYVIVDIIFEDIEDIPLGDIFIEPPKIRSVSVTFSEIIDNDVIGIEKSNQKKIELEKRQEILIDEILLERVSDIIKEVGAHDRLMSIIQEKLEHIDNADISKINPIELLESSIKDSIAQAAFVIPNYEITNEEVEQLLINIMGARLEQIIKKNKIDFKKLDQKIDEVIESRNVRNKIIDVCDHVIEGLHPTEEDPIDVERIIERSLLNFFAERLFEDKTPRFSRRQVEGLARDAFRSALPKDAISIRELRAIINESLDTAIAPQLNEIVQNSIKTSTPKDIAGYLSISAIGITMLYMLIQGGNPAYAFGGMIFLSMFTLVFPWSQTEDQKIALSEKWHRKRLARKKKRKEITIS